MHAIFPDVWELEMFQTEKSDLQGYLRSTVISKTADLLVSLYSLCYSFVFGAGDFE